MKMLITALLLCVASKVSAVPITLILSDEVEMSDDKLYVYENVRRSEYVNVAKPVPYHHTKTFDSD